MEKTNIDLNGLKNEAKLVLTITTIIGLITIIIGVASGSYRALFLCSTLGSIVVFFSVVELIRSIKGNSVRKVGIPYIQGLWISSSMGLGYVVTAPAPYFQLPQLLSGTLFIIGWVLLGLGVYKLLSVSKRTGLPLTV